MMPRDGSRFARKCSLLDSMTQELRFAEEIAGPSDVRRVDEYLESVREVEAENQRAEGRFELQIR